MADPVLDDTPTGDYPVVDRPTCRLLGPTALLVQGVMGILVILSLVYKRHRESPRRPWRIWLFDVSKQVIGQMFVHAVNVGLSDILQRISSGNACVFYFLHILVDTTLGVGVIYVTLHTLQNLLTDKLGFAGFITGQYGDPPSFSYWFRQAALYVTSITVMKLLVVTMFALFPGIFQIGQWMLSWTGNGSNFQIIFVMGIFPITMNILQFWLIDSIVKASTHPSGVALSSDSPRNSGLDREPLFRASSDEEDDDDGQQRPYDVENPPPSRNTRNAKAADADGESKSLIADSSSQSTGAGSSFTAHAYPPPTTASSATPGEDPASAGSRAGRRRSPPPHLPLEPVISVPEGAGHPVAMARLGKSKTAVKEQPKMQKPQASKDWDQAWDDDWSERVGEEDWTGKRVEAAKGYVGNVWDKPTPTIQVG